ncbi:hypothetical protein [Chthonobacter rhizosphaerae]|uniref:hypothetical protein n=1 Tax=Chthonobacter rhizosphaerae TaxID=2735553 RepID=UPI0015EF9A5B|nr:hypothetical protein [Chthonobacter rhizosphaerae]
MDTQRLIESEARRVAALNIARTLQPGESLEDLVERLWPIYAADLAAGVIDREGLRVAYAETVLRS